MSDVVASPLLNVIFRALDNDRSFEAAVECLCAVFKETREVDEYIPTITTLLPRVLALQPRIAQAAQEEDTEMYKGITRIFAEAGEAWVILIAREPTSFRPLVEAILECAARDIDREAISLTFIFWYEFKLYLILERYIEARVQYVDVYSQLVDVMLKQLEYPGTDGRSDIDLFDGDREAEEKYREFRHLMGDVLKDCCEIMGVTECLAKVLNRIKSWMSSYAGQATPESVPYWQQLEAPLFSMRAMGRMVDKDEDIILPQIIPLIVQIPPHEKLRFAAIMVLGRYTEWTANHPELLESQFTYIVSSFSTDSKEIIRAAAMSMKYFCTDCKHLLSGQVQQLQQFYDQTLDKLPMLSQEELTEGVASVVAVQPVPQIFPLLKLYCDPLMNRLMALANKATDEDGKLAVAGKFYLLCSLHGIFIDVQTRPPRACSHFSADSVALCGGRTGESCRRILPGNLSSSGNHSRHFHHLLSHRRASVQGVAIYGTFISHCHGSITSANGHQTGRRICCLKARMLLVGKHVDTSRIFRRARVRGSANH